MSRGKDRRHPEPVAARERDELGERLAKRDLPHGEPGVLVEELPQIPHEVAAHLGRVAYAEPFEAPQGGRGVALYHGDEQPGERLDVALAHVADHAEIEQGEVARGRQEEVARVGVAVEEPVLEGHLEDRLGPHGGDAPPLGGSERERTDVPEPGPLDVLLGQHPGGREVQVDPGDNDLRPGEVGGEAAGVLRLCGVVELAPDDDLELGHEAAHVHEEPAPEPAVEQVRRNPA